MAEKNFNARIIHKHDTEANWLKAENFIPKKGELIVYDKDVNYNYNRFKIGDGETFVNNLPFSIEQSDWNQTDETQNDYIKNKPNLADVAITGSWNELIDKPFGEDIEWFTYAENAVMPAYNPSVDCADSSINNLETFKKVKFFKVIVDGVEYILEFTHEVNWNSYYYGDDTLETTPIYVHSHWDYMGNNWSLGIYGTNDTVQRLVSVYCAYGADVVTLPEKFIPDTIARTSDIPAAQIQANWKQSDSTQVDFIQNKTHWEYQDILLPDTEINIVDHLCVIENFTFDIPNYEKYFITINGVDHEVTYSASTSVVQLSNQDNTIGVLVAYMGSETNFWYSEDGTYTVSVRGETIHKLDKKFLPEQVRADWNQTDETKNDFIKNKPIFSAITETEVDDICTSLSAITVFGDATLGTTMI